MKRRKRRLLAIDPGPTKSAFVIMHGHEPVDAAKVDNERLLEIIAGTAGSLVDSMAIEMVASYGMPVGAEVFDTVAWIGRYEQAWFSIRGAYPVRVKRKAVCLHLCNSSRANDATIRQALIDRYGPSKEAAIGTKAAPGPLYGFNVDTRAALAVGLTAIEGAS